jgi:hypothetical protein
MNEALIRTSILLLMFYMAWFMWDQHKLIENQRQQIQQLQIKSFYDMVIIKQFETQRYDQYNINNDNPI